MPAEKRLSAFDEQVLRRFLIRTKDYGFRSWDDAWGEMPKGYLPKFDFTELGRYDPAREDCPGQIPVQPVPEHSRYLHLDDPEYEAEQRGEVIAVAERPTGPIVTVKIWERSSTDLPARSLWLSVLVLIFTLWCIYRLYNTFCARFM